MPTIPGLIESSIQFDITKLGVLLFIFEGPQATIFKQSLYNTSHKADTDLDIILLLWLPYILPWKL